MWQGKKKAVTFSFDDGVRQDVRTIEILNKYGLKGTFNLNSAGFGIEGAPWIPQEGISVPRPRLTAEEVKATYAGHEVAVHTLHHPNLTTLSEEEIVKEVEEDRLALSKLVGYEVVGMAYPCGGVNNDERVADVIRRRTGVRYSRTITSTEKFDLQENLLQFHPTIYFRRAERLFQLAEEFLALETDKPQLFYIWGHTYEMGADELDMNFAVFEKLCAMLAGREDIFYGTNKEILL